MRVTQGLGVEINIFKIKSEGLGPYLSALDLCNSLNTNYVEHFYFNIHTSNFKFSDTLNVNLWLIGSY